MVYKFICNTELENETMQLVENVCLCYKQYIYLLFTLSTIDEIYCAWPEFGNFVFVSNLYDICL